MFAPRTMRALAPLRQRPQTATPSFPQKRTFATPAEKPVSPLPPAGTPPPQRFSNLRSQLNEKAPVADPDSTSTNSRNGPGDAPPKKPLFSGRTIVYMTGFTVMGFTAGKYVSSLLAPAALPIPLSKEDLHHTSLLRQACQALPLVTEMMKSGEWEAWDAYENSDDEDRHHLTTKVIGGMRGIGHQRVLHNKVTGEYRVFVWLGKALSGWPGVVHGGCIATVLDECLGRAALAGFTKGNGVTANLDLDYKKPVVAGEWYVIRSKAVANFEPEKRGRKCLVEGSLEDMQGKVFVKARGLFVSPKNAVIAPIRGRF